jgi:hypothetical protein
MNRKLLIPITALALAGGWYAFRPERAFIDRQVDESLDGLAVPAAARLVAVSPADEQLAALLAGRFHTNAHETTGTATLYRRPDGARVLRLQDFRTSNGPDVRVYLVAAADVRDEATVTGGQFVELGALKGNVGNQNYEVPAGLDLSRYRTVTIWCRRFSVNFGSAPLTPVQS